MNNADRERAAKKTSASQVRQIKFLAFGASGFLLTGIVTLMVISAGKGEDITGIVAPALLLALVTGAVGTAAALFEKRAKH